MKKIVFVTGCPRSGTTLVQQILSNTPFSWSMPESHLFSIILPELQKNYLEKFNKRDKKQIEKILVKKLYFQKHKAKAAIKKSKNGKTLLIALANQYKKIKTQQVFIEKTPLHILFWREIKRSFSNAKIIYVQRNPLDVVRSWLKTPWGGSSELQILRTWIQCEDSFKKISHEKPADIFFLKYEMLCKTPEKVTLNMCKFLNIPFEKKMCDNLAKNKSIIPPQEMWKSNNLKNNKVYIFQKKTKPSFVFRILSLLFYLKTIKFFDSLLKNEKKKY